MTNRPPLRPILCVIGNLLLVFLLFTLCRLVFFLENRDAFPGLGGGELLRMMVGGLRFDTSAIFYLNLLYFLLALLPLPFLERKFFRGLTKWAFVVPNAVAIVADLCDAVYFPFSGRRTTCTIFREFGGDDNLAGIFLHEALTHWYLVLLGLGMIILLVRFYRAPVPEGRSWALSDYLVRLAVVLLVAYPIVGGLRGGFGVTVRPVALNDANLYCNKPQEAAIVLNTAFSMIRTIDTKPFPQESWYEDEADAAAVFNPVHPGAPEGSFKPRNVVILVLESFSAAYSSLLMDLQGNLHPGYMPFLDSLSREGLIFRHSIAHDRISISALPAVMAGIPCIVEPFFLTPYAGDVLQGIPELLVSRKGYHSAFWHGAQRQSLGLAGFANKVGFQEQFSRESYDNEADFDGTWGIWDEPFLQYFADGISSLEEPFVASVFTLSSHHPFAIPSSYEGIFPEGSIPMHKCIGYTDMALRRFFEAASREPWYDNTLFVLTGDHTNRTDLPEYQSAAGRFMIPIIFYTPDGSIKGMRSGIAQQVDIGPTILGALGFDEPFVSFGQNLLETPDSETFAFNQIAGDTWQWFQDGWLLQFHDDASRALYRFAEDPLLENNVLSEHPDVVSALEPRLKAYVQQLLTRIVENRLTVE